MKLFVFAMVGLVSVCAFADDEIEVSSTKQSCHKILRNPICLYETYDNQGCNIGARGDILYMVYQAPVLTYASQQTVTNRTLYSKILDVPGKLSLGCNVALTYTMPNQPGYTFESSWYHIVAKFAREASSDNIVPAHSVALTLAAPGTARVNAHVAINFFDLLLKKDFGFGEWVSMTPAAGVIGGYMNGENSAHFLATSLAFSGTTGGAIANTEATLAYTSKFEGIGLKLGGHSSFKLWRNLKLKAELFYSVLYGLAKTHLTYAENGTTILPGAGTLNGTNVSFKQHHGRAFFDSLLGFAWEHTFKNDAYFVDIHAGWRFQSFSDGWKEFEAEINDSLHELGLTGQGLQAGAVLKF
jgi:hypothetical protein